MCNGERIKSLSENEFEPERALEIQERGIQVLATVNATLAARGLLLKGAE